jgi:ATP-dependent helicase/nuclease subunit A
VPLRGEYAFDDHTVEVEGQADLVLQLPDDSWQVVDLKIALTDPNAATKERYRLQTSMYDDLLGRTLDGDVLSAVETVGATAERSTSPWPRIDIDSWLQKVSSVPHKASSANLT